MLNNKQNHFSHYLLLFIILSIGIGLFFYFTGLPSKQFYVVIALSVFYFVWGIVGHAQERDLHIKIVVEYALVAILAIILLRGAIFKF